MARRRSNAPKTEPRPGSAADDSMSSDETAPAPPRRRWRRWLGLVLVLAVALLLGVPSVPWAPPEGAREGPASTVDLSDAVTLTLEPTEDVPDEPLAIRATVDGERLLEAQGRLPFALAVPRGREVEVVVEAPGRARFHRRVILDDDGPLRVPLPRGAVLSGMVVDERGEPVEGATLTVLREDVAQPPWTARTDEDGRFEIDTLLAGAHRVQASAEGHAAVVRAGIEPRTDLRLVLERAGTVAGRVVDPEGLPAASASVQIAGSGLWPARQIATDERGHFALPGIPPGIYEVRARREGLVAEPRRGVSVDPGSRVFLTFVLQEGARLTGIIRDADTGEPIEGASISAAAEALDIAPRVAVSGPEGHFVLRGLRDVAHRVSVQADGYVPLTAAEWSPGQPLEVDLVPGGTLIGVVLDEERQPIEGAHLEVIGDSEGQPIALDENRGFAAAVFATHQSPMTLEVTTGPVPPIPLFGTGTAPERSLSPVPSVPSEATLGAGYVTDEQGRFRIDGVPPGRIQLVARHDGHAPTATGRFYIAAGQTRDDLELILPPAGELTGLVLDHRGDRLEGILVEVRSDREPHPRVAFTDDRGRFTIDPIVGELTVTAMPNGQPAARTRATVEPGGEAEVELQLEGELHTLNGRTVDSRGFPIGSVQVSLVSLRPDAPHRRTVWSEEDGTFSISGLPAPPWRLEASEVGHAPSRLDVFASDEEVQLPLVRSATITGRVLDDYSGEPVTARVRLVRDVLPAEVLAARTGDQGGFRFPRARAARWELHVESEGHLPYQDEVVLEDGGRGPRDLELDPIRLTPAGRIEGTVVDGLGHPVARARVWAGDVSTRTDARGRYVLSGLAAGDVVPRASHPAAGEVEADPVRILEGRETLGVVLHLPERFDPERASTLEGRRRGVAIQLQQAGDEVRIRHVIEGSRAEQIGLRAGDVLLEVDGEPVTRASAARRALAGPSSVPAILLVRRGDEEVDLMVDRETWLPP